MKRILIIGLSSNTGGVETYVINFIRHIDRENYEIYYPKRNGRSVVYQRELDELGIIGICFPENRHHILKYRNAMDYIYNKYQFDVVYFNNCDLVSIDPLYYAYKYDVPIRIMHSHSSENTSKPNKFYHRMMEWWSNKKLDQYATHLFACSEVAGKWMFGDRKFKIIKNGIDLKKYSFDPEKRKIIRTENGIDDQKVIGFVGRLSPPKNPLMLLRIFSFIHQQDNNFVLWIIGDGEEKQEMQNLTRKMGIESSVNFFGIKQNVNELLNAMDCFLLPSLFEGLPFVLVEAQANGLPCVVSSAVSEEANIGELVEYVDLEQSPEYWAERVLEASKKDRVDVSQKLIEAGYSIDNTAKIVSGIIEDAIESYNEPY